MQRGPTFRVKRYAHPKYKFLVRWKAQGKWKRRYFANAEQAHAFADAQNASDQNKLNGDSTNGFPAAMPIGDSAKSESPRQEKKPNTDLESGEANANLHASTEDMFEDREQRFSKRRSALSEIVEPTYRGPRIERYFGDHWSMHLPFAYDLMRELVPRVFVELGVWKGESYFTFCQSAAENQINVKCYGVDSWCGDVHMGKLDPELEREVTNYNWRYSSFSELKTMTFGEALHDFSDGTIDLLHIDGAHTYCDVKSDFESWLPKLSPNGIILFHDVMVRDRGFGVWKLWEEIARPRNSFVFEFGYGLGLWKKQMISTKDSPFICRLLLASEAEKRDINDYYATAAAALALWQVVEKHPHAEPSKLPRSISSRIEIFADQGNGYNQKASISEPLIRDTWQTIRLKNLDRIYTDKRRSLRIDPIDCPCVVLLASIRIVREYDDAVLYGADKPGDFEKFRFSDNVQTKVEGDDFLLLVTDSDPQIYLPVLATLPDEALRVEITLKVESGSPDLMIRHAKTWRIRSELEMVAKTTQVRFETERDALKKRGEQQREELRLLGEKRDELTRLIEQIQNEKLATESANSLLFSRLAALEQNVKDFANSFGLHRKGLQQADSPAAALIRSLSRNIRQLRRKAFFWKVAKLLGLKAIAGISPRSAASQLKRELEGVKRILKSKKTSPGGALAALTALIFLRRRATTHFTRSRAMSSRDSASMQALFDQFWYTKTHPAAATAPMPPLQYYLTLGVKEGHNPHPLFDVNWYLSRPPRLENLEISPLEHYAGHGPSDERSPHPQFDSAFYIAQCPDCLSSDLPPLAHYLTTGWKLGCRPNPNFDPKFYLQTYPDVAAAKIEPLTHYVLCGQSEGRYSCQENVPFRFSTPDFEIPRTPLSSTSVIVPRVKAIAFYLPQFHPIPENDRWWGEGFTEWDNVRSGSPNYPDHYQPHVPIDLGYYDLRDPEVLRKQTELARTYGISGFCFYYYWFGGKVLLDLPIRTMLESGRPDFPFCICWANENWTRRWDGREEDVLIAQNHSSEDDDNFIEHIEQVLLQKSYIRVNGKPLLLVYRPSLLPSALETTARWRNYFRRRGHGDLHLTMVRSFYDQTEPKSYGFDAAVQFPPHFPTVSVKQWIPHKNEDFAGDVCDYLELRRLALQQLTSFTQRKRTYPGVAPSWDNTARRGSSAIVWANSSPEAYYEWLTAAADEVQKMQTGDERLLFINAWNEWGEGCHLEPDEKYGHAWLNATALALNTSAAPIFKPSAETYPEPPILEEIEIPAIAQPAKLAISVLFYHREDLIAPFLESLLPQIITAESNGCINCSLNLAFNYPPSEAAKQRIEEIAVQILGERRDSVRTSEHGFNLGFGAGHNTAFDKSDCDIFLMLNSDVLLATNDWLVTLVNCFRTSDDAIVGLTQTASRLREDGCGIPINDPNDQFDFVDGSVMAVRAGLARRFGLFSPAFDYFYFEDADLCLRYRQIGFKIGLLDIPYDHQRSSSSRVLPQFAVEEVLNRNRARFFNRWENYLRTRILPNRIGIAFLDTDRQLQCASLSAIISLLSEHKTAVIDIRGVHAQLISLFQHKRIRLIPSWQQLCQNDYLRFYQIDLNRSETPLVYDIAHRMGCDPDSEAARQHLQSLVRPASPNGSKTALLYLDRKSPVFDGRQPHVESFAAAAQTIRTRGFNLQLLTDYGTFEIQNEVMPGLPNWQHTALAPASDVLSEIATADLLVTSDNWVAELGQLLGKRTFIWLGAIAAHAAICNSENTVSFTDESLDCLGCYHRFGRKRRNVCLRGDIACMRACLTANFTASLDSFVDGRSLSPDRNRSGRRAFLPQRIVESSQLSLEAWPSSNASSVLVLTPVSPRLNRDMVARARELASQAVRGLREHRIIYDELDETPPRGVPHPLRQATMACLRQRMIEQHLRDEQWVFWVDADIVDYPNFLIEELIERADGGIAAPLVLMDGIASEGAGPDGFGPGRFYDIGGFSEKGHWARFMPPYFDQPGPVYQLDSVGSCYIVNADLYRNGAKHMVDPVSQQFLKCDKAWPSDAIAQNQRGPADAYTEHYSVCKFAIAHHLPVQAFADLVAYHARV